MKGFTTSSTPYTAGTRHKAFFARRIEMLKYEKLLKKADKNLTPDKPLNKAA